MEIDITSLFYGDTWSLSGSIATHGTNAGPDTWAASQAEAIERPILTTPEEIQALKDDVQASGFSEDVQSYSDADCNALMVQLVSLVKRESGLDDIEGPDDEEGWKAYEDDEDNRGVISRGDDGRVYYYLGC